MFKYTDCQSLGYVFRWNMETQQGDWFTPDGTFHSHGTFSWADMTGRYLQSADQIFVPDGADPALQLPEGM